MFRNTYSKYAWITMSFLLFSLDSYPTEGWVILLFSFSWIGNLLEEIIGSKEYNRDIITLISLYSVLIIFTPMSLFLLFSFQLVGAFLFIFYLVNTTIGIAYIKWGIHFYTLQDDLYKLKRQLIGIAVILGIIFTLIGVIGMIDLFIDSTSTEIWIVSFEKVNKLVSDLLAITIGLVFFRASSDSAKNGKV